MREAAALTAAGLACMLAGCGGTPHGKTAAVIPGRAIFARSCGGCHTLTGHDTQAPGGDLTTARLRIRDIASFARIMPVRPRLTEADAVAFAEYIHSVSLHRTRP